MANSRTTISQRIALEGVAQIKKDLADLGLNGERAIKQIQDAVGRANSQQAIGGFAARVEAARRAMEPFGESVRKGGDRLREITATIGEVGKKLAEFVGIGIAGGIAGFAELAKAGVEAIDEIKDSAQALSITTEQLQTFKLVASQSGTSAEDFVNSFARFSRSWGDAAKATTGFQLQFRNMPSVLRGGTAAAGDAIEVLRGSTKGLATDLQANVAVLRGGVEPAQKFANAFDELKISAADLQRLGNDPAKAWQLLAQRVESLEPGLQKSRIAAEIFGRSWVKIVPVIAAGGDAWKEAADTVKRYKLFPQEDEEKANERIMSSFQTLKFVAGFVKDTLFNTLADAFTPLLKTVANLLEDNLGSLREWAAAASETIQSVANRVINYFKTGSTGAGPDDPVQQILNGLVAAKNTALEAIPAIIGTFEALASVLRGIAGVINQIFGTNLSATSIAAILIIGQITGAFGLLLSVITLISSALTIVGTVILGLAALLSAPAWLVAALIGTLVALIVVIIKNWEGLKVFFAALWEGIVADAKYIWGYLTGIWNSIWSGLKAIVGPFAEWLGKLFWDPVGAVADAFNWMYNFIVGIVEQLMAKLDQLVERAAKAISEANIANAQAGAPTGAFVYAGGGQVHGPGTATSDSIPARLSDGEFVMRTAAVRRYGVGFMHALNSMSVGVSRFAAGGLARLVAVGSVKRFAAGGQALPAPAGGPTHIVQLSLFGERMGDLLTDSDVADRLDAMARRQRISSTGRMPGWRAGGRG